MKEIKLCPFCGKAPKIEHLCYDESQMHIWYVKCEHCGAEMNNPQQTEEKAVKDWNRRVQNER